MSKKVKDTCGECSKPISQTPGKRRKKFCGDTCRSNFRQKKARREAKELVAAGSSKKKVAAVVPIPAPAKGKAVTVTIRPSNHSSRESDYLKSRRAKKSGK